MLKPAAGTSSAPQVVPPSFYQRKLPDSCVAFSSPQGKHIFASALAHKGLQSFFTLIEQFTTQTEPAFCGLSTLVLVLNALSVDPQQNWKGPWRWYEESMLNCCLDLEEVKQTGITLQDFQCLAHCQGLSVDLHYAVPEEKKDGNNTDIIHNNNNTNCNNCKGSLEDFRVAVRKACVEEEESVHPNSEEEELKDVLVVSYDRKVVGQTGSGHFSPIGAYDVVSDSVLILDTARFKYGAHWAKLPLVYDAMKPIDPDTGKSRGYALLSFTPHHPHDDYHPNKPGGADNDNEKGGSVQPISMVFRSKMSQHPARRKYKDYLSSLDNDKKEVTWEQVVSYWTEDEGSTDSSLCVWQILEPLRMPMDLQQKEVVQKLRTLLTELVRQTQQRDNKPGVACCDENYTNHKTCVGSYDALFIVYLASITHERRVDIVMNSPTTNSEDLTKEQLLNEAELIASAIETSDQTTF